MRKILIFILLLITPLIIKAENLVYNVCESGCEYTDLNDVYTEIYSLPNPGNNDITVNIKDGRTYNISRSNYKDSTRTELVNSKISMIGTGEEPPTITKEENFPYHGGERIFLVSKNLYIKNITISDFPISFYNDPQATSTFENVKLYSSGTIRINSSNLEIKDSLFFASIELRGENIHVTNSSFPLFLKIYSNKYLIENSTFNTDPQILSNGSDGFFKNCTFKNGIINEGFLHVEDSKVFGSISSKNHDFIIKNTTFTKHEDLDDYYAAVVVSNDVCNNTNPNTTEHGIIDNIKIESNSDYGFIGYGNLNNYKVNITNSDLSKARCSIATTIEGNGSPCGTSGISPNDLVTSPSTINEENINIHVSNSQVNCGQTSSNNSRYDASVIYFDDSNTWTKPINRGTDLEKNNVVELNNGKVIIDLGNKGTLKLSVDKEKPIIDYFKDLVPPNAVLGAWIIEDESIVKIVDNKIVPLKVGSTKIIATIDNTNYILYINVVGDNSSASYDNSKNPETKDIAIVLVLILSITTLLIFMVGANKIQQLGKR